MTAEEIRAELRAEERDDYRGAAPAYYVLRTSGENEQTVGFVYYDEEAEGWRYGWSVDQSVPLGVVRPEEAVDVALDRIAEELAGR